MAKEDREERELNEGKMIKRRANEERKRRGERRVKREGKKERGLPGEGMERG